MRTAEVGGDGGGAVGREGLFGALASGLRLPAASLLRPRVLYVLVLLRLGALPIPIVLFAPLSLAQLGLWLAARALEQRPGPDRQALEIVNAVRAQVGQLRFMPAFALVETTVKGKMLEEARMGKHRLEGVYLKVGLL